MPSVRAMTGWASGLLLGFAAMASWAQTPAGQIMVATGTVQVADAQGVKRTVARGDTLHAGERVITGTGGLVQIKTVDGGYISVRPETEMVVESVKFAAESPKESNFVIGLIKGGFRSITGAIGKANPDGYEIRTATATIGIRGTDHEPMFIAPDAPKIPGAPPPGIYDKVNAGETFIRNELGLLAIKPGQIGFSPVVPKVAPEFVRTVPAFYRDEVKIQLQPGESAAIPDAQPIDSSKLRPRIGAARTLVPRIAGDAVKPSSAPTAAGVLTSPALSSSALEPLSAPVSPAISSATIAPAVSSSTLSTSTLQPMTATVSPTLSTSTLQTLTTTISPTLSTSTLQSVTSTIAPTLNTTTLQPLTTTISPTLSTTTTLQPLTTTISPTLSTTKSLITK